jgi:glycosyltransferase involved in cell wall biosynthesis
MKVLVNNFFWGVHKRGIPIYTDELGFALQEQGFEVKTVTCPSFISGLPSPIVNLVFVLFEQVYIPLLAFLGQYQLVIYPYNSSSVIGLFSQRFLTIYHDFIQLKKSSTNSLSLYVKFCFALSKKRIKNVAFISRSTSTIAQRLTLFSRASALNIPNLFYSFQKQASKTDSVNLGYILLISGTGENKDLATALALYSTLDNPLPLRIMGCGNDPQAVLRLAQDAHISMSNIDVLPILSFEDAVKQYKECSFVWAHSRHEGYGRAISEAKLAGKAVLCSTIPPFKEQMCASTVFYTNENFQSGIEAVIKHSSLDTDCSITEHQNFEQLVKTTPPFIAQ